MYQSPYNNNPYYGGYQHNNGYNPYTMNGGGYQPNYYGNLPQNALGQPSIGQPQNNQGYVAPPPKSNKILVVSLEDALSKCNEPNSETMCVDQDKPLLYNIMVDMQGRKTYQTFDIAIHKAQEKNENQSAQETAVVAAEQQPQPQIDMTNFVSVDKFANLQAQFMNLQSRFDMLVERLKQPVKQETQQKQVRVKEEEKIG